MDVIIRTECNNYNNGCNLRYLMKGLILFDLQEACPFFSPPSRLIGTTLPPTILASWSDQHWAFFNRNSENTSQFTIEKDVNIQVAEEGVSGNLKTGQQKSC